MIALTICCSRLVHIDPEMIVTKQKMPLTYCRRYVHRPMPMPTTTNPSTENTAPICHMRIVHCLLLLLAHCAKHSWGSGNVGSHTAIYRRGTSEVIDCVVAAWSCHRLYQVVSYKATSRSTISHTRCPLLLLLGSRVVPGSAVGSWR